MDVGMLGDALKQLGRALPSYVRYQVSRLFKASRATGFAGLDGAIDLAQVYRSATYWPSHRSDVPSAAVRDDELYKLWVNTSGGYKWLHYFDAYQSVFGPMRGEALRVLEIGVFRGSSLRLWREYFSHPQSIIVGIDINPDCAQFEEPARGINIRIGSQVDGAFLQSVVREFGPFDLIIDDGSHMSSHMITSFNLLYMDGLKEKGIYFVEDLHTNYWPQWRDSRKSFLDVCKDLVEYMHAHYQRAPAGSFVTNGPTEQPMAGLNVPLMATLIKEIRFFDSMVAIYKTRRDHIPYCVADPEPSAHSHAAMTTDAATDPAAPDFEPTRSIEWKMLGEQDGQIYVGGPSLSVLDLFTREPKFVLDVGCSNGDFAAHVKQRYPQSMVWGVEPNQSAARIAASRMDRVLNQPVEMVDWHREGVGRGQIDTVFLFDVLEHTYDPWKTLLAIRNLVSADAQVIVSIPNVRNVLLLQDLVAGHWRYRRGGLLDITHIRFFTLNDMLRMFYQMGFRVVNYAPTRCESSSRIFDTHRDGIFPQTIQLQSASITVHSLQDLSSLCAVQHMFCLQPAKFDQLMPHEREWIEAPHPATSAFGLD